MHRHDLPGKPDIVLPKYRLVVPSRMATRLTQVWPELNSMSAPKTPLGNGAP